MSKELYFGVYHTLSTMTIKMWEFINEVLGNFKSCFSRQAAFDWFVVIVIGLMLRSDHLGMTSIIRDLALRPALYESMNHFFRASSWSLESLASKWAHIVKEYAPLHKENDSVILIGDGVKQAKEARHMPAVKKLHQESENSSKAEYIFGHFFGGIGILAGSMQKFSCIPLFLNLQDGVKTIFSWTIKQEDEKQESHVVQMIHNGFRMTKIFGKSILLLDRYYLSVDALKCLNKLNKAGKATMHIVTKAKKNCTAFEHAPKKKPGRGRPPIKGKTIKLMTLFTERKKAFQETKIHLYGKDETVRYYCINLLWGQKHYQELRFVLVEINGTNSILASTDLTLDPVTIIRLYSFRFKIEATFREMKQVIGGFSYQFWSKSMPKLNRYLKKGEKHPIDNITDLDEKENIVKTIKAIEGYVMCSVIALGILQLVAMEFSDKIKPAQIRYLRTPSKGVVSEATIAHYLRKNIFRIMARNGHLSITRIIKRKQEKPGLEEDSWVS